MGDASGAEPAQNWPGSQAPLPKFLPEVAARLFYKGNQHPPLLFPLPAPIKPARSPRTGPTLTLSVWPGFSFTPTTQSPFTHVSLSNPNPQPDLILVVIDHSINVSLLFGFENRQSTIDIVDLTRRPFLSRLCVSAHPPSPPTCDQSLLGKKPQARKLPLPTPRVRDHYRVRVRTIALHRSQCRVNRAKTNRRIFHPRAPDSVRGVGIATSNKT